MSDQGALNHLLHGDVLTAVHDLVTWFKNRFAALPDWTKKFLAKGATEELDILKGLVPVGVKDVVTGGFTTDAFVKAGKDILAQLIAQNISTFTMQDVMANLNMAVSTDPDAQAALAALQVLANPAPSPAPAA